MKCLPAPHQPCLHGSPPLPRGVNELANKIIAVLRHPPLASTLRQHGSVKVKRLRWTDSAKSCMTIYQPAMNDMNRRR